MPSSRRSFLLCQIPHFLLAIYAHAVNTNDTAFVREIMPVVDRVSDYMLSLGLETHGVLFVPGAPGTGLNSTTEKCNASNWYDIVCFGHADGLVNAYALWALDGVSQLKALVGDAAGAKRFAALRLQAATAFNTWFWDDVRGYYRDWVDINGRSHAYLYADVSFLAITLGVANATQAQRIMATVDTRYALLLSDFNVTRQANLWATPVNFFSVEPADLMYNGTLQNQSAYPNYENGNTFFHTTGLEIAARARAGQPDAAWSAFVLAMDDGFGATSLWGAGTTWADAKTGPLVYSEPLTDTLMILWGFVRAAFGVEPTLVHGLRRISAPLPQLVGKNASFTFSYLGHNTTLRINSAGRTEARSQVASGTISRQAWAEVL